MAAGVVLIVLALLVVAAVSAVYTRRHKARLKGLSNEPLRNETAFEATAARVAARAAEIAAAEHDRPAAPAGPADAATPTGPSGPGGPSGPAAETGPDTQSGPAAGTRAAPGASTGPPGAGPPAGAGTPLATPAPGAAPPSAPAAPGPTSPGEFRAIGGWPLSHLLAGIRLPYGLVPLGEMRARRATGDRMALWTDEAPADVVAPAFADELHRLGYELATVDEVTLLARKDGNTVEVVVHPHGATAMLDEQRLFPTIPSELAPVIEIWVLA